MRNRKREDLGGKRRVVYKLLPIRNMSSLVDVDDDDDDDDDDMAHHHARTTSHSTFVADEALAQQLQQEEEESYQKLVHMTRALASVTTTLQEREIKDDTTTGMLWNRPCDKDIERMVSRTLTELQRCSDINHCMWQRETSDSIHAFQ